MEKFWANLKAYTFDFLSVYINQITDKKDQVEKEINEIENSNEKIEETVKRVNKVDSVSKNEKNPQDSTLDETASTGQPSTAIDEHFIDEDTNINTIGESQPYTPVLNLPLIIPTHKNKEEETKNNKGFFNKNKNHINQPPEVLKKLKQQKNLLENALFNLKSLYYSSKISSKDIQKIANGLDGIITVKPTKSGFIIQDNATNEVFTGSHREHNGRSLNKNPVQKMIKNLEEKEKEVSVKISNISMFTTKKDEENNEGNPPIFNQS